MIEAVYSTYSDYWDAYEEVTNENAKDNRIWSVKYSLVKAHLTSSKWECSLDKAKSDLEISLTRISAFAQKQNLTHWVEVFDKSNRNIKSSKPSVDYYKDFVVEKNMSLFARQLVFSANKAWVFGGMGSWNDYTFNSPIDNKTYNQLSDNLYHAIIQATITGVNE